MIDKIVNAWDGGVYLVDEGTTHWVLRVCDAGRDEGPRTVLVDRWTVRGWVRLAEVETQGYNDASAVADVMPILRAEGLMQRGPVATQWGG